MADRFLSVLKAIRDVKVETGQSITRKNERIAKLAGRGSELEVITYKLCEAAGNGLIDKAQYQKFLEITLQAPPAPAVPAAQLCGHRSRTCPRRRDRTDSGPDSGFNSGINSAGKRTRIAVLFG